MFSKFFIEFQKTMIVESIKAVLVVVAVVTAIEMHMLTLTEQMYQSMKMCEKDKNNEN